LGGRCRARRNERDGPTRRAFITATIAAAGFARHELDATLEVNGPAVCRAIVDTGFSGYVAHEFVPTRDPLTSLRDAVAVCDV
jgi:hydroxypyruvate isomerase